MANIATDWSSWRRSTTGGIKYKLVEGYPRITHGEEGTDATEQYIMRSIDIPGFVAEAMPPPYVLGGYVFLPPRRLMPGTVFVTKTINIEPQSGSLPADYFQVDSGATDGTYDYLARVTIDYTTNLESGQERDPNDPTTFLEHSMNVGGEFYDLPPKGLHYDEDGDLDDPPAGYVAGTGREIIVPDGSSVPTMKQVLATIQHNLRWPFVLDPDWDTIFDCLGKVNDAAIDLFKQAAAETVLFQSISGSQKHVWNGASASTQPWQLDFKFSQRVNTVTGLGALTWNHSYLPIAGKAGADANHKWIKPYYMTTENDPSTKRYNYETCDMLAMFRSSQ